jgi:hypothetical protein
MTVERSERLAGVWTPDMVEQRLQSAMITLRRLPVPRHGMPMRDRSHWPDVVRTFWEMNAADDPNRPAGATAAQTRKEHAADRNRIRIAPSNKAIREMDECLAWLMLITDTRKRKVVFARSHVHEESGRHLTSYRRLEKCMGCGREGLRLWYRHGLRDIAMALSDGR